MADGYFELLSEYGLNDGRVWTSPASHRRTAGFFSVDDDVSINVKLAEMKLRYGRFTCSNRIAKFSSSSYTNLLISVKNFVP